MFSNKESGVSIILESRPKQGFFSGPSGISQLIMSQCVVERGLGGGYNAWKKFLNREMIAFVEKIPLSEKI